MFLIASHCFFALSAQSLCSLISAAGLGAVYEMKQAAKMVKYFIFGNVQIQSPSPRPAMWIYGRSVVWSGISYDTLKNAATRAEGERSEGTAGCKAVSHNQAKHQEDWRMTLSHLNKSVMFLLNVESLFQTMELFSFPEIL